MDQSHNMDHPSSSPGRAMFQELNVLLVRVISLGYLAAGKMSGKQGARKRALWTTEGLVMAVTSVRNGDMGLRAAAKAYGVPKSTVKRHIEGTNKYAKNGLKRLGRPPILPDDLETELANHILDCENRFFGFTRESVLKLAYDLAERNNLAHVFNKDKKKAGKMWLRLFMRRHPDITVRQPEATSLARASGFNRESVNKFFDLLQQLIDQHGFNSTTIYNLDETAVSTVQKRCQKVLAKKGKHQIGSIKSEERGSNTTAVCCASAAGQFVPPLILFKRKRMTPELSNDAPAGSMVIGNESGWMDKDTFVVWLQYFISVVSPSPDRKVLLILDGHGSHTKSIAAIELARHNHIIMLSLPPHTTHKLQPLDVAFFRPLQLYYNQTQETWLRNHPGRKITAFQLCGLFNTAYSKAAVIATVTHGFAKTGIWPFNRHVFSDVDFCSLPTNSPRSTTTPSRELSSEQSNSTERVSMQQTSPGSHPVHTSSSSGQQSYRPSSLQQDTNQDAMSATSSFTQAGHENHSVHEPAAQNVRLSTPSSALADTACHDRGTPYALRDYKVIKTCPDGRCFFRSIVISLNPSLQTVSRDENGNVCDSLLKLQEQFKADTLRAQTVQYMMDNINDFREIAVAANFDMPAQGGHNFSSFIERILAMSVPTASVGETKITSTAEVLQMPIHVLQSADGSVIKYKDTKFYSATPIKVLYTSFGDNTGHYEALIKKLVRVVDISPIPRIPEETQKNKKMRKTESQILTLSPYKRSLENSKKARSRKVTKNDLFNKTKLSRKNNSKCRAQSQKENDASWYCHLCTENTQEDMIKCQKCLRWVHEACAGEQENGYVCDFCKT